MQPVVSDIISPSIEPKKEKKNHNCRIKDKKTMAYFGPQYAEQGKPDVCRRKGFLPNV